MEVKSVSVAFSLNFGKDIFVVVIPKKKETEKSLLVTNMSHRIFLDPQQSCISFFNFSFTKRRRREFVNIFGML